MTRKYYINMYSVLTIFMVILFSCATRNNNSNDSGKAWKNLAKIIDSIQEPTFNNTSYSIINYGAQSGSNFDNSKAFKNAIETCSINGGGIVLVPAGKYYTGPIHLENNVNLHLEENAEILFSTKSKDFPIVHTSFEGTELMNYSPLIYAYKKTNVAVTGKGKLNGQANNDKWWSWSGSNSYGWRNEMPSQADPANRARLVEMAEEGVPVVERVFGEGHYLRPNFIEFFECKNSMIKEVTIVDAPFWILHPIKSKNIIIDGVTIISHGPNNDGCDPEYCKNIIIRNCVFNTGDDCIAIKAGRDSDGRRVAIKSENIIVQNCKMFDGHGGVTIGSEISAGVRNVFVENCVMSSPNLDRAIRIKTNSRRGGLIENVYVRNLTIGEVKESLLGIDMYYSVHGNQTGKFIPEIKNIYLENIKVKNAGLYGILAKGYEGSPIKNFSLTNVTIDKVKSKYSVQNIEKLIFINTTMNGVKIKTPKQ